MWSKITPGAKNSTFFNNADASTQFSCQKVFNQVINNPQTDFSFCTLKVWFYDNILVLNPKQCHFTSLENGNFLWNFSWNDIIIKSSLLGKTLGLTIDNTLDFSGHIANTCKTANQKLNDCMLLSCHVHVSEWIDTLWMPRCQGTPCSKQMQYLKF